ncbi:class I SAM-dependent methyltransferase [Candidatus Eisenbacteria bacterium]|uniref:Class I SAM-dependent methyltransferase n=1 Tax=Eiseniibacteriota bacterium TaxID=2212470 RepID=A0ABV6YLU3_UNCEI
MSFYTQFAEYYERIFPFREEAYAFLRDYLPDSGKRVLDLGCGPGHYCGRFAADGFKARGVDLDGEMIAAALGTYPEASFHQMDIAQVHTLPRGLDLAVCIGNVAAHLTQDEFLLTVRKLHGLLQPGAVWIVQVVNWDRILDGSSYTFPPKELGSGRLRFLREYRDITEDSVRFLTRLERGGETLFTGDVQLFPTRRQRMIEHHERLGFRLLGHFGDFSRATFDPATSPGSIYVFEKANDILQPQGIADLGK